MKQGCFVAILAVGMLGVVATATARASSEHWEVKVRACTNQNFDCVHGCKEYVLNTSQCHVFEEAGAALAFRCSARKGINYVTFQGPACETIYPAQVLRQTCGCDQQSLFLYECDPKSAVAYQCASCTNGTGGGCTVVENVTLGQCNSFADPEDPSQQISVALPSTYSMIPVMEFTEYPYVSCDAQNHTLTWYHGELDACDIGFGQTFFQISCEDSGTLARLPPLPPSMIPHVLHSLKQPKTKKQHTKRGW